MARLLLIVLMLLSGMAGATPGSAGQPEPAGAPDAGADANGQSLEIRWRRPVPAAIFERAGVLWLVFGAPRRDLLDMHWSGPHPWQALDGADQPDKTVLRFRLDRTPALRAMPSRTGWTIRTVEGGDAASAAPGIEARDGTLLVHGQGVLTSFADPDSGEVLHLLMSNGDPGSAQARNLVDIDFLPSFAGLAWRSLADGVVAEASGEGLTFSRAGGLRLAAAEPNHGLTQPIAPGLQPLDLKDDKRRRTRDGRSTAPGAAGPPTTAARSEAARRLLADGLGAEALAMLDAGRPGAKATPPANDPQLLLRGAAELLLDHADVAARMLAGQDDPPEPERALWQAAAAAELGAWPDAARALARAKNVWTSYPPRLRFRLGLTAARILVEAHQVNPALAAVERLSAAPLDPRQRAELDLVKARVLAQDGDPLATSAALGAAARDGDLVTKVRASFAAVDNDRSRGAVGARDALGQLERQRLLWRGHPDEVTMLDRLAGLQRELGDVPGALDSWQTALGRNPKDGVADAILARMHATLADTMAGTGVGSPDAITAYALYRRYPALLGRDDRPLVTALGDRLAKAGFETLAAALQPACGEAVSCSEPTAKAEGGAPPATSPASVTLTGMLAAAGPLGGGVAGALTELDQRIASLRTGLDHIRLP